MSVDGVTIACVGCGASVPDVPGVGERPGGTAAGCWAAFCEVLAREYSDFRYARSHRLTVDAYTAQHADHPSPRAVKSLAVHLVGLHVTLELDYPPERAMRAVQRAANRVDHFRWLEPPRSRGALTILDVRAARDAEEHLALVQRWARSVWEAWTEHHATVRAWAKL